MKLIIVGGPPSVGKTSVLIHAIKYLNREKKKTIVIKSASFFHFTLKFYYDKILSVGRELNEKEKDRIPSKTSAEIWMA